MINKLQLLRNIGQFDSVNGAANIQLAKLTLVYAENGRGKTTLAAILRSLASGDPVPINERKRLASQNPPHVVIDYGIGQPAAIFQNGNWVRNLPNLVVFDDHFVDQNVYSGLTVESEHRQNLHELIIGSQGVMLNRQHKNFMDQIEIHNTALRAKAAAIPSNERGELTVDEFCDLPDQANIDGAIQTAERDLAAAKEQNKIQETLEFSILDLPEFDIETIGSILPKDLSTLDSSAAEKVKNHLIALAGDSERWVSEGMLFAPVLSDDQSTVVCPFCAQDLNSSPLLDHYRAYFSEEYNDLKRIISDTLISVKQTHGEEAKATFERLVGLTFQKKTFWSKFCDVPEIQIDTATIFQAWQSALVAITNIIELKQGAPLDQMTISEEIQEAVAIYEEHRQIVFELNQRLQETNLLIQQIKLQAANANLVALNNTLIRLKSIKARYSPAIVPLCTDYLVEKVNKAATELLRDQAKQALEQYRIGIFPNYQNAINIYLSRFNAGFTLGNVTSANTRGGSTCNYNVLINNIPVPVSGGISVSGTPSFRNTLSAGDRNTLALAFFLASIDQDPDLANKIVVVDDPVSSMDEHRALTTVQEIRSLAQRVDQVIVLSHSKHFLCSIWDGAHHISGASIHIVRNVVGSTIQTWDVNQDSITENDRRHKLLREYVALNIGINRIVASAIRPSIEAFMRVAFPEHFPPGTLLGPFRGICEQRVGTAQEILNAVNIQELRELVEYGNKFHHDTNPAWDTELINDGELLGFVRRTLQFAKR